MGSEQIPAKDEERKDELVEITKELVANPAKFKLKLKVTRDTVRWIGTDEKYWVLFTKATWPFIESADKDDNGRGNSEINVEHGTPSRPFTLKAEAKGKEYLYVIVSVRTRGIGKPPEGPAVIGEG